MAWQSAEGALIAPPEAIGRSFQLLTNSELHVDITISLVKLKVLNLLRNTCEGWKGGTDRQTTIFFIGGTLNRVMMCLLVLEESGEQI